MRKVRLYRDVYPIHFDITHTDPLEANEEIVAILVRRKLVSEGDIVLITKGDLRGRRGGTNNLKNHSGRRNNRTTDIERIKR